jgi:hypothetical protein
MKTYVIRRFSVVLGVLLAVPLSVFCSNVPCWRTHSTQLHGCPMQHRNVDFLRGAGGYF